jgi:hypothetical protein
MLISGSIGYSLLEQYNKKVLIFADIHDGVSYCQNDSLGISDLFKNRTTSSQVLLEEVIHEKIKLKDLWPNAKHTQELKTLARENPDKIVSVDIRPFLVIYSWELIDTCERLGKYTLFEYIQPLEDFFQKRGKLYTQYISKELEKNKNNTKVNEHLKEINEYYDNFKKNIAEKNLYTKQVIFIKINHIDILEEINHILSIIMEWYIILLIFNSEKNSIVHTGLAHSNKISELLIKVYKFNKIDEKGINFFEQLSNIQVPSACLMLPHHIKDMFNRKYGFYR